MARWWSLPWRRAPRTALASPVTVAVAMVTGLVVAFVAAGTVCYVSATSSAAVQYVVDKRCYDDTGAIVTPTRETMIGRWDPAQRTWVPPPSHDFLGRAMEPLRATAARHGLDVVVRTRYAGAVSISHGGRSVPYWAMADRDGALQHTRPISASGDRGLWVQKELADWYGLRVGSELTLHLPDGERRVPVTGIYPKLSVPLDEFWCSEHSEIVPTLLGPDRPPWVILVSPELMDELVAAGMPIDIDRARVASSRPVADRSEAERHAVTIASFTADAGAAIGDGYHIRDRAVFQAETGGRALRNALSSLVPLAGICLLVGLAAVVGLARQWVQRRHAEVRLLFVRGASPAALGVKALLELALPLAAGCGLGWLAARVVVPWLAPAAELDPWAPVIAAVAAGVCWLVSCVVLAAATTARVRAEFEPSVRRGRVARRLALARRVPWELAGVAAAVMSYRRLVYGALVEESSLLLPRVDAVALLFPLFCLAVVLGVVLRMTGWALRSGHRLRAWRLPAAIWALRRAAAQHRLTTGLLAVAGLAVGVIAVGAGVSATEQAAIGDKGRVFVGSDTAVRLSSDSDPVSLPDSLRGRATKVSNLEIPVHGGRKGRVLAIDPATFADGVVWREQWAAAGLDELLDRLGPAGQDGQVPVLRVGSPGLSDYRLDDLPPVREVASVPVFPGRAHSDGMLVLAVGALSEDQLRSFTRYAWARAEPAAVTQAFEASGEASRDVQTAAAANDGLPFLMIAWTFEFFVVLGVVLAAVAAAALLVQVEARRRSTALAYGLLERMGLRIRTLFASYLVELTVVGAVAAVVGLFGGWLVLTIAGRHLDPSPRLSPSPTAASLWPLTAPVAVAFVVTVVVVAGLAVRSAVRAPIRELLRG